MKLTAIASLFLPSIHALAISAPQTITLDSQGPSSVRPLTRRTNDNSKWPQGISEHFFDQKLDHDDIASKKTFKQRYLVSDRHYVPGGPVILYLPGDDSAEAVSDIFDYGIVDTIAKETNGLAILLEHRYYGASIPTPDLTTVNLQWLTVAQALEDFANFAQKVDLGYDNRAARINVPWISYGSGYGGALVAFLQSNYKNVTFAGIASSASVQFKVDFWEYWENIRINGGQCTNYVVEVVDYIDNLHSAGEKDKIKALKKQFGLQDLIDYRDFMWVLSHVLEEWRERKWYDSKAARVWPNFCKTLASAIRSDDSREDRMTKLLANYSDYIFKHYVVPALRTGIQNVIAKWHTPAKVPPQNLTSSQFDLTQTWRPYLYQKSAPAGHPSLFSRSIDVDYISLYCRTQFSDSPAAIPAVPRVENLNKYGGFDISAPRLAFIDGKEDPWLYSTVHSPYATKNRDAQTSWLIPDGNDGSDAEGIKPSSTLNKESGDRPVVMPGSIKAAQSMEIELVKTWIKEWSTTN